MFRLGFNNEQKKMLGRTISELQELRVELSVLRDSLKQIFPGEADSPEESGVIQEGGSLEGIQTFTGESELPMSDSEEKEIDILSEAVRDEDCSKDEYMVAGELIIEDSDGVGGEVRGDESYPEEVSDIPKRDWAVVDFSEIKRPWWKMIRVKSQFSKRTV
ncbi:MAG: hypothetical protein ACYDEQ_08380 [Desulfocucumaceae bacterium]